MPLFLKYQEQMLNVKIIFRKLSQFLKNAVMYISILIIRYFMNTSFDIQSTYLIEEMSNPEPEWWNELKKPGTMKDTQLNLKHYSSTKQYKRLIHINSSSIYFSHTQNNCHFTAQLKSDFFRFLRQNKQQTIQNSQLNTILLQNYLVWMMNKLNLENSTNYLTSKIITNLVSFNSLYEQEQSANLYTLANNYNRNSKKLLLFGSQYLKLHQIKETKQFQDEQSLTMMAKDLLQHISREYYQMNERLNSHVSFEQNLNIIMEDTFVKLWINKLLQIVSASDMFEQDTKQQSNQQIAQLLSKICLFKLIKSKLMSIFGQINFYYNIHRETNILHYCKLLGKYSNVSEFLQIQNIEGHSEQKQQKNKQQTGLDKCIILQIYYETFVDKAKVKPLQDKFYVFYAVDLLKFTQDTLRNGLSVRVKKENLFVENNHLKYRINQVFFITKAIEKLKSDCPSLYDFITSQSNGQHFKLRLSEIYDENKLEQRRKQHFALTQQNVKSCFQTISNLYPSITNYMYPLKMNYAEKDIHQLNDFYKDIKTTLNNLKFQESSYNWSNQIQQFQSKEQAIQSILICWIDTMIYKILKTQAKLSYGQSLIYLKSLKKQESFSSQLLNYLFPIKQDKIEAIKDLASKLKDINKSVNSGVIGVQSVTENQSKLQVESDYINPIQSIILSQFNPQQARDHIFRACLPCKHSQSKQNQKQFNNFHAYQVVSRLIKNKQMCFQNLSKRQIKCPLFLPRHLIIKNKINTQNYPIIYPQLNIINCFIDNLLMNQNRRQTLAQEFYINLNIKSLSLSTKYHNYLIYFILMLLITRHNSQSQFLFQLHQFFEKQFHEFRKTQQNDQSQREKLIIIIKSLYFHFNNQQECHPYVTYSRTTTSTIKTIQKSLLKQSLYNLGKLNKNNDQELYNIQNFDFYSAEQRNILANINPPTIIENINNIQGQISHRFFIFKLNNQMNRYKKQICEYKPGNDKQQNKTFQILLELNYINRNHLFRQYFQYNKSFDPIYPIIQFTTLCEDKSIPPYHKYLTVIQNIGLEQMFHNTYHNEYFRQNQLFNIRAKKQNEYFLGLKKKGQKIIFIKDFLKIAEKSKLLQIQLLNLNLFSIGLFSDCNLQRSIPKFNQIPFIKAYKGKIYKGELEQQNQRLYKKYYRICSQAGRFPNDNFTLSSYPPIAWQHQHQSQHLRNITEQIRSKDHQNYANKYDIGNIGYILCLFLYYQQDEPLQSDIPYVQDSSESSYFHQLYTELKNSQNQNNGVNLSSKLNSYQLYKLRILEINTIINQQLHIRYSNSGLYYFMAHIIHAQIQKRLSFSNAIECLKDTSNWEF